MFSAIASMHPETESFLYRAVTRDNADCTPGVKLAIRQFCNQAYSIGLRDGAGDNHVLRSMSFSHSTNLNRQKLFWITGNQNVLVDAQATSPIIYNNSTRYGWDVGAGKSAFDLQCRSSQFSSNDCSMAFCYTWSGDTKTTHVGNDPAPTNSRWLYHPTYGSNTKSYYDCGNAVDGDGRVTGERPSNGFVGIHVCTKTSNVSSIYFNGTRVGHRTDMNTNRVLPNATMFLNAGAGTDSIGGYCFGRAIPTNLIATYHEMWRTLMKAINPDRVP